MNALGFDAVPTIKKSILAMKEVVVRMGQMQNEQRAKSLHMSQIPEDAQTTVGNWRAVAFFKHESSRHLRRGVSSTHGAVGFGRAELVADSCGDCFRKL